MGHPLLKPHLLVKLYRNFAKHLKSTNTKNFQRFITWLQWYIQLKQNEKSFKSTYLPKYEEGQIIFIDFGCGISHEFSYPHYAVVLTINDRKKNDLLTVVPMTSKKDKHKNLKPWEHELQATVPDLLAKKALSKFDLQKPEYAELKNEYIQLTSQNLSEEDFNKRYNELLKKGVQAIYENNHDIMNFGEKMKQGSIVETNQIRTISKSRIKFPLKKIHPLYDIKVDKEDLYAIKTKIMKNIIISDVDKTSEEHI